MTITITLPDSDAYHKVCGTYIEGTGAAEDAFGFKHSFGKVDA